MTAPDAQTEQGWRRPRPVRVLLDIADRALHAGIAVAAGAAEEADVVLIDRPVATAFPAIALAPEGMRGSSYRSWPASVCAVVPADTDAETLAAIITVVAAGYALMARRDAAGQDAGQGIEQDDEREADAGDADAGGDPDSWTVRSDAAGEPGSTLSAREREVLTLLAGGASNKEIALALGLSVSTVKFHVAAITGKLGARSRVDAVAIAVRAGLVSGVGHVGWARAAPAFVISYGRNSALAHAVRRQLIARTAWAKAERRSAKISTPRPPLPTLRTHP